MVDVTYEFGWEESAPQRSGRSGHVDLVRALLAGEAAGRARDHDVHANGVSPGAHGGAAAVLRGHL